MRIHRQTEQGTSYAASFSEPPSPETLEALDQLADAARKLIGLGAFQVGIVLLEWAERSLRNRKPDSLRRVP